jgi:hypothetical protein
MGSKRLAKKNKDLSPKKSGVVKGGKIATNDNVTLVRAAKPTKKSKDLAPKSGNVKGGKKVA